MGARLNQLTHLPCLKTCWHVTGRAFKVHCRPFKAALPGFWVTICANILSDCRGRGSMTFLFPISPWASTIGWLPLNTLRNVLGSFRPDCRRIAPIDSRRVPPRVCAAFGVRAGRIPGLTGVWCGLHEEGAPDNAGSDREKLSSGAKAPNCVPQDVRAEALTYPTDGSSKGRKICAIGIHVSRGITSHGFAFNVTTNLRDFALINPCGITDRPVTSLEREIADQEHVPSLEAVAHQAARQFGAVFDQQVLGLENLEQLRAQAQASPESREFPPQDSPLRIPPEIERLSNRAGRQQPA